MHARVFSATTLGIHAHRIDVEADLALGLAQFTIVGLPDKAIKESRDRIRAALKNSGLRLPPRRATINLAPAELKKSGALFDVPIALALLHSSGVVTIPNAFFEDTLFLGELSLDGSIRPVSGVLAIVHSARRWGIRRVVVPHENAHEASLIERIDVVAAKNLAELVAMLAGTRALMVHRSEGHAVKPLRHGFDFADVKGQESAKRALLIAATGGHNVLFVGPPGSGKTMLAQRFSSILPPLSFDEMLETMKVYSSIGGTPFEHGMVRRPLRAPHHTISQAGLIGGGATMRPGEISLAHNGVLFLDELPEFKRSALEALREPLERGEVLIARARGSVCYPASFILVAALNPCPCGYFGDRLRTCSCTSGAIAAYMRKLSGPFLDRIDLHVRVEAIDYDTVISTTPCRSSQDMYTTVCDARERQHVRQQFLNVRLRSQELSDFVLSGKAQSLLKQAFDKHVMSMRSYHAVLKVARSIADIAGVDEVKPDHVYEALSYRFLDRCVAG